jgi:hypothetical protein
MQINKQQQNIIMIMIVVIVMIGFSFLVKQIIKYNKQKKVSQTFQNKEKIDLEPRPFSELLDLDFPEEEDDTIQDSSVCNSTRIIEEWKRDKIEWTNSGETKLSLLDNCWREYENELLKFKFRDIDDSVSIKYQFGEKNGYGVKLVAKDQAGNYNVVFTASKGKDVNEKIKDPEYFFKPTQPFYYRQLSVKKYLIKKGLFLYRVEQGYDSVGGTGISLYYQLSFNDEKLVSIGGKSRRFMKEVLPTIELK